MSSAIADGGSSGEEGKQRRREGTRDEGIKSEKSEVLVNPLSLLPPLRSAVIIDSGSPSRAAAHDGEQGSN